MINARRILREEQKAAIKEGTADIKKEKQVLSKIAIIWNFVTF